MLRTWKLLILKQDNIYNRVSTCQLKFKAKVKKLLVDIKQKRWTKKQEDS